MTILLGLLGFAAAIALFAVRGLLGKEIQGRVERRITASVEATIASMPPELQAEWADEWRADLCELINKMPISAALFARNVRLSAKELVSVPALAAAGAEANQSMVQPGGLKRAARRKLAGRRRFMQRSIRALDRRSMSTAVADQLRRLDAELSDRLVRLDAQVRRRARQAGGTDHGLWLRGLDWTIIDRVAKLVMAGSALALLIRGGAQLLGVG